MAMSPVFTGTFISQFKAHMEPMGMDIPQEFISKLYRNKWVVFANKSFVGAKGAIEYFGRYSHKAAISNYRIKSFSIDKVLFSYKDHKHGCVQKSMAIHPHEFVRRSSLHILTKRFTKIRHYGNLFSKTKAIVFPDLLTPAVTKIDWITFWKQKGLNTNICPNCKKQAPILIGEIPKRGPPWIFLTNQFSSL